MIVEVRQDGKHSFSGRILEVCQSAEGGCEEEEEDDLKDLCSVWGSDGRG